MAKPTRKPGRPVGTLRSGASERVQIRLTPADKQTLAKIAKGHGKTMSGQIAHWIGVARDD